MKKEAKEPTEKEKGFREIGRAPRLIGGMEPIAMNACYGVLTCITYAGCYDRSLALQR
jgi:hypothetical protein